VFARRLLGAAGGGGGFSPPVNSSLTPPVRGAFYFPWYPEGWDGLGYTPFTRYTPTLGAYYSLYDAAVLEQHVAWAKYAGIEFLCPTWRGRPDGVGISATTFAGDGGTQTDVKIVSLLDWAATYGIKVAMWYEVEGYANPTAAQVEAEFDWLAANRFNHRAYLYVDGRPVIFVFTDAEFSSAMAQKYSDATAGFTTAYVMIQTHTDPSAASPQPDGWYTFSADRAISVSNSYNICPGFWRPDQGSPTTSRDLTTWEGNIDDMVASGKDWQMVLTFNEWGEGSQVEPSTELGPDYLDALAANP
jgi:hypothetical protein